MLALSAILILLFDSALQAVDDALGSAAEVKKTSKEVDKKFERAIEVLSQYQLHHHPTNPASIDSQPRTVHERMAAAKTKDKSSSTILNGLKEKFCLKVRSAHFASLYTNAEL